MSIENSTKKILFSICSKFIFQQKSHKLCFFLIFLSFILKIVFFYYFANNFFTDSSEFIDVLSPLKFLKSPVIYEIRALSEEFSSAT